MEARWATAARSMTSCTLPVASMAKPVFLVSITSLWSPKMESAQVSLQETWGAMEKLQTTGLAHSIGVCNYNTGLLGDLLNYAEIKPAMLQIESHPYLTQEPLLRLCEIS